jgi:sugar lactone lactonase YvrE
MRALAAFLALALIAGCSERPRSNPFDPANPSTGGRPAGFQAIAQNGAVSLRWQPAGSPGTAGYVVYRRVQGETDFRDISSVLSISASSYYDAGAANGLLHEYRLYFVLDGALSGLPAEDSATPGPRRVWVADLSGRTLSLLSADGRYAATTSGGYLGPTGVAFDARNRRTWVADTYDGRVVGVSATGFGSLSIGGLTEPVAIAVDSTRDDLWVCDQARDAVYHYTLGGAPNTPFSLGGIDTPLSVASDPVDGSIWVCERGGDRVRRYSNAGSPAGAPIVAAPSRVAVDSLSGPIGVAVESRRGRIWIADAIAGTVVALDRTGAVQLRVTGLPRVREVAVDLATGECFASVPGIGRVVRLSPTGAVLTSAGGFVDPYGVVVEP